MTTIFIANRSVIVSRVARAAHALGYRAVGVASEADKDLPYISDLDDHRVLPGSRPAETYLNIDVIIQAALDMGANAIHPGYGFLAENTAFADRVREAGLVWIGPPNGAMQKMASKKDAKELARKLEVPVIPGDTQAVTDLDDAKVRAELIGYPIMLKAAAGGGGIGMSVVKKEKALERALDDARQKGRDFFGDDTVILEKFIENPHHVEIQVLSDKHGNHTHLFERECSVQRRNQKLIEECPSPFITEETRQKMCAAAVRLCEGVEYEGAGTVEFVVDAEQGFYFLEMNTRIQVEHGVTEMCTGIDIVAWQIRVALGEQLSEDVMNASLNGTALEARICVEDANKRFLPSPGVVNEVKWPERTKSVRVESGVLSGNEVTPFYDSMVGKVIAFGKTRDDAITQLDSALTEMRWSGTAVNIDFHRQVLSEPTFKAGIYDTSYIKRVLGLKY